MERVTKSAAADYFLYLTKTQEFLLLRLLSILKPFDRIR